MAHGIRARDAFVGKKVTHFLFPQYGIGRITEIKHGTSRTGGTQLRCEFPKGPILWLSCQEVKAIKKGMVQV